MSGTTNTGSPNLDKWILGNLLREARTSRGMTLAQVGAELDWSAPRVMRWETGDWKQQSKSALLLLLGVYGLSGQDTAQMVALFEMAKKRSKSSPPVAGHPDAGVPAIPEDDAGAGPANRPPGTDVFAMLEMRCAHLRTYQNNVVHGLLQSPAYVEHLFSEHTPEADEDAVRQRLDRAKAFFARDPAPALTVVLNASVQQLSRTHPEVWYEQVRHLVDLADRHANLALHWVDGSPVSSGPFTLWSLRGPQARTIAYSSGGLERQFSDDQGIIDGLDVRWSRLLGAAEPTTTTMHRLKEML